LFWNKRKKDPKKSCNHYWYYLQDDDITIDRGACVDIEDGCWIFCSNCEKEMLVYKEKWDRIKKKQEILSSIKSESS